MEVWFDYFLMLEFTNVANLGRQILIVYYMYLTYESTPLLNQTADSLIPN